MDPERIAEIRSQAVALYQKTRAWAVKVPLTARVVAGFICFAALLMGIHSVIGARDATLRLKVQHSFRTAHLEVWIDDDQAYSGKLNGSRKRFGLFSDAVQGTLSETLGVPSGIHRVKVRVEPDDGTVHEDTISGDFPHHGQRTLAVSARRSDISLNWQGAAAGAPDEPPSSGGWFAQYASALLLTAAGSIISAITGYALRELPGHIRARQSAGQAPKS
jgi:hypothetical protein